MLYYVYNLNKGKTMETIKFLMCMPSKIHQEVKIRAAMRNVTMARWINQAIVSRLASERKHEEWVAKKEAGRD